MLLLMPFFLRSCLLFAEKAEYSLFCCLCDHKSVYHGRYEYGCCIAEPYRLCGVIKSKPCVFVYGAYCALYGEMNKVYHYGKAAQICQRTYAEYSSQPRYEQHCKYQRRSDTEYERHAKISHEFGLEAQHKVAYYPRQT